jgi:hypothetical protein
MNFSLDSVAATVPESQSAKPASERLAEQSVDLVVKLSRHWSWCGWRLRFVVGLCAKLRVCFAAGRRQQRRGTVAATDQIPKFAIRIPQ